jgi:acyl-CoA synthetase (AMP-forming)/AMP-acid ligase II/aryl carrier-like protein
VAITTAVQTEGRGQMGHRVTAPSHMPPILAIREHASICPDAPALLGLGPDGTTVCILTYRRLVARIDATVATLAAAGTGPRARVACVAPPGVEAAVAFLGATALATAAPLNPAGDLAAFSQVYDLLRPDVLLAADGVPAAVAAATACGLPVVAPVDPSGGGPAPGAGAAATPGADDIALLLPTSGTTSRPKLVPLTHSNLGASAANVRQTLELTAGDRCLNVMPLFHIHGLVAALLASLTAGGSVACAPAFEADRFAGWLTALDPTWYTAVPTIHQAVLRAARGPARGTRLRFARSSSSALPGTVLTALEEHFGVPVIEAYGMSEAAHQISSNPLPPGERVAGSVGFPAGPEVSVLDADGVPVATGRTGEVAIRGTNVITAYAEPVEANVTAFTGGWLRTGDEGHLDEQGRLRLTGRIKELVNRGGEKIAPREVEEELLEHPGIDEAVAFAVPHPVLGEEVGVAVVSAAGHDLTVADVRAYARARLVHFKLPRHVVVVPRIPKGPTGKVQRVNLAAQLGLTGEQPPATDVFAGRESATPLEAALLADLEDALGRPGTVAVHDDLVGAGCDSIQATGLLARIRERDGVELDLATFFRLGTVAELAAAVVARQAVAFAGDDLDAILDGLESRSAYPGGGEP